MLVNDKGKTYEYLVRIRGIYEREERNNPSMLPSDILNYIAKEYRPMERGHADYQKWNKAMTLFRREKGFEIAERRGKWRQKRLTGLAS